MGGPGEKNNASGAFTTSNKGTRASELDAIADMLMEKRREYLEPRLAQLHEMGKCTNGKLNVIQTELASLSGSIGLIKADISALKSTVDDNSEAIANHETALQTLELKMVDGTEGSNAVQYLTRLLPRWFPSLQAEQPEVMRAHWIYSGCSTGDRPCTLISNVLRYKERPSHHRRQEGEIRRRLQQITATIQPSANRASLRPWTLHEKKELNFFYSTQRSWKSKMDRVFNSPREAEERTYRAPASKAVSRHTCSKTTQAAGEDP